MKSSIKTSKRAKSLVKVIAITGSSGSGKSTLANIFAKLGALIIDADLLAREVVEPGSSGLAQIKSAFGAAYIKKTGDLNRKKLGSLVFSNPHKLKKLEKILHPLIRQRYQFQLRQAYALRPPPQLIAYSVPLYFESAIKYPEISSVIVVDCDRKICIKRIVKRDNITKKLATARLAKQFLESDKAAKADFVIKNNSTLANFRKAAKALYRTLTKD